MIKYNSKVELHYSISSLNNIEFESTFDKKPIKVLIGDGTIPQRLELTLYGLKEGSQQTLCLDPKDAFGERNEENIKILSKKSFPNIDMIKIGNVIEVDVEGEDDPLVFEIKLISAENGVQVAVQVDDDTLAPIDVSDKLLSAISKKLG